MNRRQEPAPDNVRVPPKRSKHKPYWIQQYHPPIKVLFRAGPKWIWGGWYNVGRYRTQGDCDKAWATYVRRAHGGGLEWQEYRRGGGDG